MKIADLSNGNKRINIVVKIGEVSPPRDITSKASGEKFRVADATVMDESGTMKLTLWNDQMNQVKVGDNIELQNAYVTEFRGEKQLNIGKFGKMIKVKA